MRICYLTEADLSISNGRGINEREFVDAAFSSSILDFRCVAPEPAVPENYRNEAIDYVPSHRHGAAGYSRFMFAAYKRVRDLHEQLGLSGFATRLDVSPLVAHAVQRRLGLPVVLKFLIVSEAFSGAGGWPTRPSQLAKRVFRPLFRSVVDNAVAADTASWVLAEELREAFRFSESELVLIRNGANLETFTTGHSARPRRDLGLDRFDQLVGYVGVLGGRRHLDSLLRAFARVAPERPGFGLVLVGDGTKRRELEASADRFGMADQVVFTGQVPYEDVPKYMQAFDAGVDLSATPVEYSGKTRYASFSQKTAQYLGSGCPVIAWNMRDMLFIDESDIGWTVPRGEVEALSRSLRLIAEMDPDGLDEMRERARQYAEEHLAASVLTRRRLEFWVRQFDSSAER